MAYKYAMFKGALSLAITANNSTIELNSAIINARKNYISNEKS